MHRVFIRAKCDASFNQTYSPVAAAEEALTN
jgi:hypothetical protein